MKTPLYMAFRLWFQANLVNSSLFFLGFVQDGVGDALMILFWVFLLGLLFTLLLVPFIHLLNRFVMNLNYAFGIRFFTLLFFQSILALLFWFCMIRIVLTEWMTNGKEIRYLVLVSVCAVVVAVLINWSRFRDLEAESKHI